VTRHEPGHVRRRICTHRQTQHCQTSASLHGFPSLDEQASASVEYLNTQQNKTYLT